MKFDDENSNESEEDNNDSNHEDEEEESSTQEESIDDAYGDDEVETNAQELFDDTNPSGDNNTRTASGREVFPPDRLNILNDAGTSNNRVQHGNSKIYC
jgi:hypothetical protein